MARAFANPDQQRSNMEIAGLVVASVAALAAVAGAVVAVMQAGNARRDRRDAEEARDASREARDEATRLAGEANGAFKRQAIAQEEANEIEEAKLPKSAISFGIVPVRGDTWAIVCTDLPANEVTKGAGLSPNRIMPLETEPRERDCPSRLVHRGRRPVGRLQGNPGKGSGESGH